MICKEATVKLRLLFTSALFLFMQIATMHAQETVDVAKITCQQVIGEQLAPPTHDIVMWLNGYYSGSSAAFHQRTIDVCADPSAASTKCDSRCC